MRRLSIQSYSFTHLPVRVPFLPRTLLSGASHNRQPTFVFLTQVNFRLGCLPEVRLGTILGCSDLTEWEAKRDLALAAQTVYLQRWCQWSVGVRECATKESWILCEWVRIWSELNKLRLTRCGIILSFEITHIERGSDRKGQQNMRGLVASTELEMEMAEADDMMVRKRHFVQLIQSKSWSRVYCLKVFCLVLDDGLFVAVMVTTLFYKWK